MYDTMKGRTYRILDILSRRLGTPLSINEMTKEIDRIYGKTHYAEIYKEVKELERDGRLTLVKSGRSSTVSLNFESHNIADILAEVELWRKRDFLVDKQEMQMLLLKLEMELRDILLVSHVLLAYPERNSRLNKIEVIVHLKEFSDRKAMEDTKIKIYKITEKLQRLHNIGIDCLILENEAFFQMLKLSENNVVREMLGNKIAILRPQDFWLAIKAASDEGMRVSAIMDETNPGKITEDSLVFNLARFGYIEFGPTIKHDAFFCIEYIIASIMFHRNARRMDAIPIIIAKNKNTNYDLLLFLALKYGFEGRMLGILQTLKNIVAGEMKELDEPIKLLEAMNVNEVKANANRIREKLSVYNVT